MSRRKSAMATSVVRRHRPMYQLALYMGLLLMLGLVVMYAIGPQRAGLLNHAYGTSYGSQFFFQKQLISAVIALVAFAACALVPHTLFSDDRRARQLFIVGLVACVALVFVGAVLHIPQAEATNGAYRWLYIGGLGSFQPSELLKFGALVFFAGFLGTRARQGLINDMQQTLVPLGIAMGAAMFTVVVLQKDLGTGLSLVAIVFAMMIASGMDARLLRRIALALGAVGLILTFSSPHRVERLMTFLQGDRQATQQQDDNSYHITQARIAIGSGGLLGLGIGNSVQSTGYLPEAINDSIFAILGETFGFVGLLVILGLFTALLLSLLRIASRLPDMRLRLMVVGVFGWVAAHVVFNVAAMTGVAPLTGIPLPLLSYGGTSMLFIAAALGVAFQLSRYTTHTTISEGEQHGQDSRSRRRVGRTRDASRRSM